MTTPAIFINCFEVPAGCEDTFMAMWNMVNDFMRRQPGYISHRLHRAVTPDARFRFINYVHWRTVDDFRAAHGAEFRALIDRPDWRDFVFVGTVCEVVDEYAIEAAAA